MREINEIRKRSLKREKSGSRKRPWPWLIGVLLVLLVFGAWVKLVYLKHSGRDQTSSLKPGVFLTKKDQPAAAPPPVPAVETQAETEGASDSHEDSSAKEEQEKEERYTFYNTLPDKKDRIVPLTPDKKKEKETPIVIPPLPSDQETSGEKSQAGKLAKTSGGFTIQVAALKDRDNVNELVSALKEKGHEAYVVPLNTSDKGTLYRIRIGHYQNQGDAQKAADKLSREGLNTFVLKEE